MENRDVNFMQLEVMAKARADLLPQVTFVGGCTTILLVDESAHFGVRKTDDVDVIVNVATLLEYHQFAEALRRLGFREDSDGPICRWLIASELGDIKLDVMPTNEGILGFSNRWYETAINNAVEIPLSSGIVIKVISLAYFLATKFEAFGSRGNGEFFSHDLEDVIFVMENRNRLIFELMDCDKEVKQYLAHQAVLLLNDDFLNVLPGLLNHSASARGVENSLKIMSSWI